MDSTGPHRTRTGCRTVVAIVALTLLAYLGGCTSPNSPGGKSSGDGKSGGASDHVGLTAEQIANHMLDAYRQAESYADHATYVQHSVHRGEGVERDLPFFYMSLAFERPNRLRLAFEEAVEGSAASQGFTIASNGVMVRAMAGALKGQIQESAAPAMLTLENFLPDPYLREVFQGRTVGDVFPQLAMLVNTDERELIFPSDEAPQLLEPRELRGRRCYRIASNSPAGTRTLWVDSETYILHRMELPVDAQRRTLDPEGVYSQLAIWIDFEDASFNANVDAAAFDMEVPKDARRVRRFVLPPPAAPPDELGKPLADVEFMALDGSTVTPASLAGKTVLLDFWQLTCAPCKAHTPELDAIYRDLAGNEGFEMFAVNTEPPTRASNEAAEGALRSWGGTMPILRIGSPATLEKLQISGTPTLLLVDAAGRLQYRLERQVQDAAQLRQVIERVVNGEDIAARARGERRRLVKEFERELDAVTIRAAVIDVPITNTRIAERRLPQEFDAAELWKTTSETVAQPGYLLVAGDGGGGKSADAKPRVVVLDGAQDIVELDANGNEQHRQRIPGKHGVNEQRGEDASGNGGDATPIPAVGFLRTAVDGQGDRYFVAAGAGYQKLHVFDDRWNSQLAFPKERSPGIADVQLAPFGPQGEPRLYVGYWGGIGLQGVGLDGRRKWSDRSLDQVVQITAVQRSKTADAPKPDGEEAAGDAQTDAYELWCTSNRGTILVLDSRGRKQDEIRVGLRTLMYLAAADLDENGELDCCGVDLKTVGQYGVVGFSPGGEVAWQFDLPEGEYSSQVDRIQSVTLPGGQPAWMIVSPDGTIYWLDRDGQEIDRFSCGQPLRGLSLTNREDAAILWVSTPEHVAAYTLTLKR